MITATITSKGQITIPAEVRKKMDLKPGDHLNFWADGQGNFSIHRRTNNIMALAGCIPYDGPPVSLEEMDEAIAQAIIEENYPHMSPPEREEDRAAA